MHRVKSLRELGRDVRGLRRPGLDDQVADVADIVGFAGVVNKVDWASIIENEFGSFLAVTARLTAWDAATLSATTVVTSLTVLMAMSMTMAVDIRRKFEKFEELS